MILLFLSARIFRLLRQKISIIDKNAKTIVNNCQSYLDAYADGYHPSFSTDIDYLLVQLHSDS